MNKANKGHEGSLKTPSRGYSCTTDTNTAFGESRASSGSLTSFESTQINDYSLGATKARVSLMVQPKEADRGCNGALQLESGSQGIMHKGNSENKCTHISANVPTVRPGAVPIQGIGRSGRGELQDYLTIDEDSNHIETPPMLEGRLAEDLEQGSSQVRQDMPLVLVTAVTDEDDQTDQAGINFQDPRIQCGLGIILIGLIGLVVGIVMALDHDTEPDSRSSVPSALPSEIPTVPLTTIPAPSGSPTNEVSNPPTQSPSYHPTPLTPSNNPTSPHTTMEPTDPFHFFEMSMLDISANYDQLDCDLNYYTCYNRNAIAFSQTGTVLATRAGMEIILWGQMGDNEWERLRNIPPLPLAEGLRHKQNLCLLAHEYDTTSVYTVALAFANHAAVYQLTTSPLVTTSRWTQLGEDFEEFVTPTASIWPEGHISVQLDTNTSMYSLQADDSDSIVLAIATANNTDGSSRTMVYEFNKQDSTWASVLGGSGEIVSPWYTAHPLSISLGGAGTRLAIGVILFTGTGRVQVYGRPGHDRCYSGTNEGSWCKLGDDITSGNYEDLSASSVALSQSGDTLAVGTPGFYDCPRGDQCSLVRVYALPRRANEPVWVPVGQPVMAFEDSGNGEVVQHSGLGFRVDISANGDVLAVTREGYNHEGDPGIYLYRLEHSVWQKELEYTWRMDEDLEQPLVMALAPRPPFSLACGVDGNVTVFHSV